MTVEIIIRNEAGEIVVQKTGDAFQPLQFKLPAEKPLVRIDDGQGETDTVWSLFMFTYAPQVSRGLRRKQA